MEGAGTGEGAVSSVLGRKGLRGPVQRSFLSLGLLPPLLPFPRLGLISGGVLLADLQPIPRHLALLRTS